MYRPIPVPELVEYEPIPLAELVPIPLLESTDPYTELIYRFMQGRELPQPDFALHDPGLPVVDYGQYGRFEGVGTENYRYVMTNREALITAVGEGIHPNEDGVVDDPGYRQLYITGQMDAGHWDALNGTNLQAAFMTWAQASAEPGVKAYFTAVVLERAGLIEHAIKAYHAVVVHFPWSPCRSANGDFVWYVAPAAVVAMRRLCLAYPQLELAYEGGEVIIQHAKDTDIANDIVRVRPGRLVKKPLKERFSDLPDLSAMDIVEQRGEGRVQIVRFENGHWQMLVDGEPFVVRGVTYGSTEIGLGPGGAHDWKVRWAYTDKNGNGRPDAPYDAWVDANANGGQDDGEEPIGDFALLRDMGCNAIRIYLPNDLSLVNSELLRDLYETYGIRVIAGDFLGAYTVGSGASWAAGTDYTDPDQRARMKEAVRKKVMAFKDEPWVLMWLLGNENNMAGDNTGVNATRTNAGSEPEAYASLLNEVAVMIHELDPDHPVAVGNLGVGLIAVYSEYAPELDVLGINAYMGGNGFGGLWEEAKAKFDRPVLITEYGCDAYAADVGPDEAAQADYHEGCLKDIVLNQAGGGRVGNSIGGVIFHYLDEWWKAGDDPFTHTTKSSWRAPVPDGEMHEEWLGIVGQGSGLNSPFERRLREAYRMYTGYWGEENR